MNVPVLVMAQVVWIPASYKPVSKYYVTEVCQIDIILNLSET